MGIRIDDYSEQTLYRWVDNLSIERKVEWR